MGIVTENIQSMVSQDIFDKKIRERATQLRTALYDRRTYYNNQKRTVLSSRDRKFSANARRDALLEIKDSITFLTIRINKITVMQDKNIYDEEVLDQIDHDYHKQL